MRSTQTLQPFDLDNHKKAWISIAPESYHPYKHHRRLAIHPWHRNHGRSLRRIVDPPSRRDHRRRRKHQWLIPNGLPCHAISVKKSSILPFIFVRANACFARVRKFDWVKRLNGNVHMVVATAADPFLERSNVLFGHRLLLLSLPVLYLKWYYWRLLASFPFSYFFFFVPFAHRKKTVRTAISNPARLALNADFESPQMISLKSWFLIRAEQSTSINSLRACLPKRRANLANQLPGMKYAQPWWKSMMISSSTPSSLSK